LLAFWSSGSVAKVIKHCSHNAASLRALTALLCIVFSPIFVAYLVSGCTHNLAAFSLSIGEHLGYRKVWLLLVA
jgi:hypothetical protein